MPKGRKPPAPKRQQLLVEGKNDQHVIWALCEQHQVPETFSVEVPQEENPQEENIEESAETTQGIEVLLRGLSARLKEPNLQTLGIVVDADQDLLARWDAVRNRLRDSGYQNIPESPPAEGWVYAPPELPRVGVWLMPNNQLPGMLENFVAHLIPSDDTLYPKAQTIV